MRFGLHVPNFGPFADPAAIGELAAAAERSGWSGFFVWDHVARAEGSFPMCDPWIALAVAAVATERLRLGPLVTPLARRRPWNVAREVATLDHLSGGRMVLGVGLGVSRGPEFHDFSEEPDPRIRGDLLDEGLHIIRAAWTGEPVTHFRAPTIASTASRSCRLRSSRGSPIWGATSLSRASRPPGGHTRRRVSLRTCSSAGG